MRHSGRALISIRCHHVRTSRSDPGGQRPANSHRTPLDQGRQKLSPTRSSSQASGTGSWWFRRSPRSSLVASSSIPRPESGRHTDRAVRPTSDAPIWLTVLGHLPAAYYGAHSGTWTPSSGGRAISWTSPALACKRSSHDLDRHLLLPWVPGQESRISTGRSVAWPPPTSGHVGEGFLVLGPDGHRFIHDTDDVRYLLVPARRGLRAAVLVIPSCRATLRV